MGAPYAEHGFGFEIDLSGYQPALPTTDVLFGESQGRAVVTCAPDRAAAVVALADELGVPVHRAGVVGAPGGAFRMKWRDGEMARPVGALREVYFEAIPRRMGD